MTIAMCYVSPEGVVLGADSTTTYEYDDGPHYYNNEQKVFEIEENGTLGLVTWGLGGLDDISYRTLVARFADNLEKRPARNLSSAVQRWATLFGAAYRATPQIKDFRKLASIPSAERTEEEQKNLDRWLQGLAVGFYMGGYVFPDRRPGTYQIMFQPNCGRPSIHELEPGPHFAGAPDMINRLIYGIDPIIEANIMSIIKHNIMSIQDSNREDIWDRIKKQMKESIICNELWHPSTLPIRDAVDFVNFCITSTIKAFKFSTLGQICGGPAEIAVITTDRRFRWVRHKTLDAAITEGD